MSYPNLKILYVITSLRTGGAERVVAEITKALTKEGHEVDILAFDGTETNLMEELINCGVNIYRGKKGFYQMYNPSNIFKIKRLAKQNHYDIIHSHNTSAQFLLAFSGVGRYSKLVTTEHNTTNFRRNWKWLKSIDKLMYRRYDTVISVSDKVKRNLLQHLDIKSENNFMQIKFPIIHNGIDLSKFSDSRIDDKLPSVILMNAAFRKQKDHATAIRAMLHLPDSYILWLTGEGETKKDCEKLVNNLNLERKINFLGNIKDIPALISQVKIVFLSSNYEGQPLSAIEGMASGKPFIASDVDGLREIVADAGIFFERGNDRDLANKIKYLMDTPSEYKKVAERCRQRAMEFDIKKTVTLHKRIYNEFLLS